MDWITWALAGGMAAVSVALVVIILMFVKPMRDSPARHIVKAKREGKPVVFLDCGSYFSCNVGEDKSTKAVGEKAEMIRVGQGFVRKTPKGMKYCEGVLMGFGEDFRAMVANVAIMDLIDMIEKKGWDVEEVNHKLTVLVENLKKDLNLSDAHGELRKQHNERLKKINDDYENQRAEIIMLNEMKPKKEDAQNGDN